MPHRQFPVLQRNSAKRLRSSMSEAEKRLWYHLRAHRFCGARFRRQAPIGPYIVDFVCHDARLVIELDGGQHGAARQAAHDVRRTAWLADKGYRVLRFWNLDVLRNIEETSRVCSRLLLPRSRATPLPVRRLATNRPPSQGGR